MTKHFNIGNVAEWQRLAAGEVIEATHEVHKRFDLEFVANEEIDVYLRVGDPDEKDPTKIKWSDLYLIATGVGQLTTTAKAKGFIQVSVIGRESADIFVRTKRRDQRITKSKELKFTNLEPRNSGPDALARAEFMAKKNQIRRDAEMKAERDELRETRRAIQQELRQLQEKSKGKLLENPEDTTETKDKKRDKKQEVETDETNNEA